jgi:ribosomal protein RSM22 (predicted rRNA methylase)
LAERQPSKLHVAGSNPVSRSTNSDRVAATARHLRASLARAIRSTPTLEADAAALSRMYRSGGPAPVLADPRTALAYASVRMPATFAATARALAAGAERLPGFEPHTLLDVGSGTGAAAWAATAVWPELETVALVERELAVADLGRRLAADRAWSWRAADVSTVDLPEADLVTAGYLLGELPPDAVDRAVDRLWTATRGALVIVEPGSRAGFDRIIAARSRLIAAGAHVAAPCPGDLPCPVAGSRTTWCHFLARLDRSPLHRRAKAAERSWEDEPFSYVVAARPAVIADPRPRVVLGRPRRRPGVVELRVCDDGRIETVVLSRRNGPAYRASTDLTWGDALPVGFRTEG